MADGYAGGDAAGWGAHIKQWMIDPQQLMAATCCKVPEGSGADAVSYYGAAAWKRNGDDWAELSEDQSWAHVMKVAADGASFDTYPFPTMNDAGESVNEQINEQTTTHKVIMDTYKLEEGDRSKRLPALFLSGKKYTYCSWEMRDGGIKDCFFGQKDPKGGACLAINETGHVAIGIWDETAGQTPSDARKCVVDFVSWFATAA